MKNRKQRGAPLAAAPSPRAPSPQPLLRSPRPFTRIPAARGTPSQSRIRAKLAARRTCPSPRAPRRSPFSAPLAPSPAYQQPAARHRDPVSGQNRRTLDAPFSARPSPQPLLRSPRPFTRIPAARGTPSQSRIRAKPPHAGRALLRAPLTAALLRAPLAPSPAYQQPAARHRAPVSGQNRRTQDAPFSARPSLQPLLRSLAPFTRIPAARGTPSQSRIRAKPPHAGRALLRSPRPFTRIPAARGTPSRSRIRQNRRTQDVPLSARPSPQSLLRRAPRPFARILAGPRRGPCALPPAGRFHLRPASQSFPARAIPQSGAGNPPPRVRNVRLAKRPPARRTAPVFAMQKRRRNVPPPPDAFCLTGPAVPRRTRGCSNRGTGRRR